MDLPDAAAATAISTTPVGVATVADLPAPSPPTRTSARTVRRGGSHDGVSTRHGPSVDASTTTTTTTTLKASCLSVTDAKVRTDRSRSSSRLVPKKGAKPAPKKNRRSNNSSTAAGSRDASSSSSTPENLRRSTTTKPSSKVEMIEDVHPNRLANPLIPDHNLGKLQDLLTVTNGIEFHLPDTYSVHYLANVLGLSHLLLPPDNANGKVSVDSLLDRLQRPSSSLLPTTTTAAAVASIGTTTTADSDSVFGIPARRGYWDYVVNGGGGGGNDDDDDDEVRQLRRTSTNDWDPLYTQLWETPWDRVVCVPVTALQHSKLWPSTTAAAVAVAVDAATAPTDPTTTTKTTEDDGVAVTTANTNNTNTTAATGVVSSNPTTAAAKKLPRRQQQQRMVAVVKDAVQKAAAPTVTEAWQTNRVQCWPWERACERYSDGGTGWEPWLRSVLGTTHSTATNTTAQTMGGGGGGGTIHIHPVEGWVAVRECMDRTTTISKNTCGGVAAVAAGILYQFEWYRNIHQSVESSELIVRVLDVSTTLATAATPPSDGDQSVTNEVLSLKEQEETQVWLRLMLMALVLEQARVCDVWYALVPTSSEVDRAFYQTYFGMIPTAYDASVMVCDLHRCSSRCTFLRFHEEKKRASDLTAAMAASTALPRQVSAASKIPNSNDNNSKQRWLVCLPTAEDAKAAVFPPELGSEAVEESSAPPTMQDVMLAPPPVRLKRPPTRKASNNSIGSSSGADAAHAAAMYFSSADKAKRSLTVALRAVVPDGDCMKLFRLNAADETVGDELMIPLYHQNPPSLDIMRNFSLITPPPQQNKEEKSSQVRESATGSQAEDPISQELIAKQKALTLLEKRLEPTFYSLLASVVTERVNYESAETAAKYDEEKRILEESRTLLDRRKELDMAWQKQLEQDMDAVCDICADGEVTPDNQILFCEFCNVAVHQMCYGVERVPEGDYYCMACRRLGRDKQRLGATQLAPQALPIYCELCPLRQGAYIRTDIKRNDGDTSDRWVHVVCAKWQGCAYVDNNNQELIEDVTDLKQGFRRHGIRCELCLGERGAMNKCMGADGCKKWFHVTCARAAGKSQVTHGENCRGPVEENPWSLACPEHSILTDEDIQENAVPVDILILAARKFPPEPKPPPPPKPFNTLTGSERKELLADPNYERALISELLLKKFFGVRCEVCDVIDEDSKNLTRCVGCNVVFCSSCKLDLDDTKSGYKCPSCTFVERKEKAGEAFETPQCCTCYQVGGFLREGIANPVNRKSYWKTNLKEFEKSVFGKQLWVHALCAFWLLTVPADTGIVDLSNVLLSDGKGGFIKLLHKCFLCGQNGGLKMKCDGEHCCTTNDGKEQTVMHVTCARQAGLEVRVIDTDELFFYVRCYRHGGNEFNLRAQLEDMLELEKKRAGKDLARADSPMKFSDASRILNAGIQVMRTLGWAWRWAEWWVDYDSSWEPFLEPGQNENKMTKEELKIVDSTRESRCDDARRCRLPAFGAALRNRDYDTAEGFNIVALDRALRAVMRTKSLVGPFEEVEIDFFLEWLGRAYRSKSRLLCLGAHKNQVSENAQFCIHMADKSPKYVIGERPIPGTQELPRGTVFEVGIDESDDFMKRDLIVNSSSSSCGRTTKSVKKPPRSTFTPKSKRKRAAEDIIFAEKAGAVAAAAPSAVKKRVRDRPQSDRDLVTQHISAKETVTATRSLEERRDLLTVDDSDAIRSTELCAPAATISYSGKKRGRTAKVRYDLSSTRDSTTETATYSGLRHGRPKKKQKRNTFADALSESSQRSVDADTTDWIDQGHEFPVANAEVTSMRTEVCIEETPSSRPSMKLGVDVVPIGESRPLVVGTDTVQVTRGERELPSAATEANFVEINVGTEGKSLSVPAEATIFLETEGGDKDKQCK